MRKHPVLISGIGGVLVGALTFGGISAVQAAGPPPGGGQPSQPVTVTNTGSNPVPVSGPVSVTQNGTWSVGITGTPIVDLASGTNTIGNVGITGTPNIDIANTPTMNVGSLPSLPGGSNAIGSVSVSNFPSPSAGARSLTSNSFLSLDSNSHQATPWVDTSTVREIRVLVGCGDGGTGNCSHVTFDLMGDLADTSGSHPFFLDEQSLASTLFKVYELPGLSISLKFTNNATAAVQISWFVAGWAT